MAPLFFFLDFENVFKAIAEVFGFFERAGNWAVVAQEDHMVVLMLLTFDVFGDEQAGIGMGVAGYGADGIVLDRVGRNDGVFFFPGEAAVGCSEVTDVTAGGGIVA